MASTRKRTLTDTDVARFASAVKEAIAAQPAQPAIREAISTTLPPEASPIPVGYGVVKGVDEGATSRGPEVGVSGTAIWSGRIYGEANAELQWQLAYGVPGQLVFGEWEKLERTNPYVTAALEFTAAPIRDALFDVEPADPQPGGDGVPALTEEAAAGHAAMVRTNIDEWIEPGWPEITQQMVKRSQAYGFSLHERVYDVRRDARFPGGKGYFLKKLAERLPSSVYENGWIQDAATGELAIIRQRGPKLGKWVYVDLPAAKTVLHTWNRTGDNYAGWSAMRSVWYVAKIQFELLKMTGVALSREGSGVPYVYAAKDAPRMTATAEERLIKELENLCYHENSALILPRGWNLAWLTSAGGDKSHIIDAYHQLGQLILFQVQAQQMSLGLKDTGSRAVGQVHSSTSEQYTQGVAANMEQVLNGVGGRVYTGIPKPLVDMNFGPQAAYPKISITLKKAKMDPLQWAQGMAAAIAAGLIHVTADDENAGRELYGLAPIEEADRDAAIAQQNAQKVAEAAAKAPPPVQHSQPGAPGQPTAGNPSAPPTAAPGVSPKPAPKPPAPPAPVAKLSAFAPSRPLRASEKQLDLAAMSSYLDAGRDDFARGAKPILAAMLVHAKHALAGAEKPGDVGELELDASQLQAFITSFCEKARAFGYGQVRQEHAQASGKVASSVVHFAAEEEKEDEAPAAAEADDTIEAMSTHLTRRMTQRLKQNLEKAALDAQRTGGDFDDAVSDAMDDLLDTNAEKADAGLVLTKAFNVGREEFASEHGDEVDSVELSAVLDSATCDSCSQLDGSEYDFNSEEHDAHVPPLSECSGGDNCRCLLIYNFKKPGDDSGEDDGE